MKTGRYACRENWRGKSVYDITVEAKENGRTYELRLVEDNSVEYNDVSRMFADSESQSISKEHCQHSIVNKPEWFVLYPYKSGTPFLFELVNEEA